VKHLLQRCALQITPLQEYEVFGTENKSLDGFFLLPFYNVQLRLEKFRLMLPNPGPKHSMFL
jgi:hypothetical protein